MLLEAENEHDCGQFSLVKSDLSYVRFICFKNLVKYLISQIFLKYACFCALYLKFLGYSIEKEGNGSLQL